MLNSEFISETWGSGVFPSHRLLNRLCHRNTAFLSKSTTNNLYTNRHTIHQLDIICGIVRTLVRIETNMTYTALD